MQTSFLMENVHGYKLVREVAFFSTFGTLHHERWYNQIQHIWWCGGHVIWTNNLVEQSSPVIRHDQIGGYASRGIMSMPLTVPNICKKFSATQKLALWEMYTQFHKSHPRELPFLSLTFFIFFSGFQGECAQHIRLDRSLHTCVFCGVCLCVYVDKKF